MNGVTHAGPRPRGDRGGPPPLQEADRAERDAERTSRPPALREAERAAPAGPGPSRKGRPQGPRGGLTRRGPCPGAPDSPLRITPAGRRPNQRPPPRPPFRPPPRLGGRGKSGGLRV